MLSVLRSRRRWHHLVHGHYNGVIKALDKHTSTKDNIILILGKRSVGHGGVWEEV